MSEELPKIKGYCKDCRYYDIFNSCMKLMEIKEYDAEAIYPNPYDFCCWFEKKEEEK
jgi:hypothetical protein